MRPVPTLALHLHEHFLPHTAMLHTLSITRPRFMLSNILQVQMNMAYLSTQIPPQQYKYSIIFRIIMIRRYTLKRRRLPRKNTTNSQPSVTPVEVVNSVLHLKKVLLLNCSNFSLCQKNHSVSRGIEKILTDGEVPIHDTKPKKINLRR